MSDSVRPRTAAYQASPSIDQPFFLMTLSIIPAFKRRRNRKTGVGIKVGKVQTAGLTWVGFFKQLLLVGRKQRLTEEINVTEKHHKQLLSLFSFSCDALKSHPSPRLGPLDTACIHLPFKVSSLSIFPNIYFLPVPRPVFRFRKGLDWLLALETFLHE